MSNSDDPDPNSPVVYMALSLLCSNQNSLVPEILYILSADQVINFIKVFGGETIRIPTAVEFGRDLTTALACYHTIVEGKSWDWFMLQYKIDGNYIRSIKNRVQTWWDNLAPGEREFIDTLKYHERVRKREADLIREDREDSVGVVEEIEWH
jgi:hypothetical protein